MLDIMPIGIYWLERGDGPPRVVEEISRFNLGWIAIRCSLVTRGCAMSATNISGRSVAYVDLLGGG